MHNILIISEIYKFGGVETQIAGQVRHLTSKGLEFHLMCQTFDGDLSIPFSKITKGVIFSERSTCLDVSENVSCSELSRLVDYIANYIKTNNIDMIHVHPFATVLPAVLAAELCKIPIVFTIHGPASFYYNSSLNGSILRNLILTNGCSIIYTVADYLNAVLDLDNTKGQIKVLKNAVDTDLYMSARFINNRKWALVSRLSADKTAPFYKLIDIFDKLKIKKLDIFGDGEDYLNLKDYIKEKGLESKIELKGRTDNLYDSLRDNYDGVIGMGRVLLEGMSMNLPCVLLSYDGFVGAVTEDNLFSLSNYNFNGRASIKLTDDEIVNTFESIYDNPQKYQIRNIIIENFDEKSIWNEYYEDITKLKYEPNPVIGDLLYLIRGTGDNIPLISSTELYSKLIIRYPDLETIGITHKSMCNYYDIAEIKQILLECKTQLDVLSRASVYNPKERYLTAQLRKLKRIFNK